MYHVETEVHRFMPDEVLLPSIRERKNLKAFFKKLGILYDRALHETMNSYARKLRIGFRHCSFKKKIIRHYEFYIRHSLNFILY